MCIAKRKDWQSRSCCSRICCHPNLHYLLSEHQLYSFLQRMRSISQFPAYLFYTQPAETGTWRLFIHLLRSDGTDERAIQSQYCLLYTSAIAIDTIINQRANFDAGDPVYCIYVAIGQKGSTVASIVNTLHQYGAMDYKMCIRDRQ